MFVTLERALAPGEGVDLSFLFDRKVEERPAGVDHLFPAALLGLALLPVAAGLFLLVRNLLAWRRQRRRKAPAPRPLPERPEALSPEVFGSLFSERTPLAPAAGEVWRRLRDAKAVVVDRQEPPNLVLRADPSDLRPPEAALVGLLFGDRGSVPLAQARETAARLGGRLDGAVEAAFSGEALLWLAEAERFDAAQPERGRDVAEATPVAFVVGLVPLAFADATLGVKVAGVAAVLLAFSWLDPEPRTDVFRALFLSLSALLVVRAGFVGTRPGAKRETAPMRAWALEQREALGERLLRGGGEVDPAEAPWFRAAGLEVSLSEPGVPGDDMEEALGVPSGKAG